MSGYSQDYSGQDGSKAFWDDVFQKTFQLSRSNLGNERMGAVAAISMSTLPFAFAEIKLTMSADALIEETVNVDSPDRALGHISRLLECASKLILGFHGLTLTQGRPADASDMFRFGGHGGSGSCDRLAFSQQR